MHLPFSAWCIKDVPWSVGREQWFCGENCQLFCRTGEYTIMCKCFYTIKLYFTIVLRKQLFVYTGPSVTVGVYRILCECAKVKVHYPKERRNFFYGIYYTCMPLYALHLYNVVNA